jgi:hypothetical protein
MEHRLIKASIVETKNVEDFDEEEATMFLSMIKVLIKKDKRYAKGKRIEMESYSDYGSGISNNAKRGIELNEKNNNKCATQVGKVRAQQLAKGEPISVETIKRMYSYLSRAEVYYDESDMNSCGTISFLLWGGKAGLGYSKNKLRELGLLTETEAAPAGYTASVPNPSIPNSSYAGEPAKGKGKYIHPALIGDDK